MDRFSKPCIRYLWMILFTITTSTISFGQQPARYSELLPVVSPDGKQIAFLSTWSGGKTHLFIASTDGSNARRLVPGDTCLAGEFSWSPDSKKIANGRKVDGVYQITIKNIDGSGLTMITKIGSDNNSPAWHRGGNLIAFESMRNGNFDIYTYNFLTGEEMRVTSDTARDTSPNWSAFGDQLIFHSRRNGVVDVFFMNADGTGLKNLTNSVGTNSDPGYGWFPDNVHLAFDSNRDGQFKTLQTQCHYR